jgi:hypothetical protein
MGEIGSEWSLIKECAPSVAWHPIMHCAVQCCTYEILRLVDVMMNNYIFDHLVLNPLCCFLS